MKKSSVYASDPFGCYRSQCSFPASCFCRFGAVGRIFAEGAGRKAAAQECRSRHQTISREEGEWFKTIGEYKTTPGFPVRVSRQGSGCGDVSMSRQRLFLRARGGYWLVVGLSWDGMSRGRLKLGRFGVADGRAGGGVADECNLQATARQAGKGCCHDNMLLRPPVT